MIRERKGDGLRPAGWTLGLPAVGLLALLVCAVVAPQIEDDLRRGMVRVAEAEPGSPLARFGARAEIDGRDVLVVADAGLSPDIRIATERRIAALPGVRSVRTLETAPIAMRPYRLDIRRGDGVALMGGAPSADFRRALVGEAARIVPSGSVDDRLQLVDAVPDGTLDAGRFLLRALAELPQGAATLTDRVFAVRGTAPTFEVYDRVLAALRSPPPGFTAGEIALVPPVMDPFSWTARRSGDALRLDGAVGSEIERVALLGRAARLLPGVQVDDRMRTARGLPAGIDFGGLTETALAGLAALQDGVAELSGRRFRLSGDVVGRNRAGVVAEQVRAGLPRRVQVGAIELRPVPAAPFWSSIRRESTGVTLKGFVPDDPVRREAAVAATGRFLGEPLSDERIAADGAPPGFADAQRVAVSLVGELSEGEALIRDRTLRVRGRILYRELGQRLRDGFPQRLPAGWTGEIALESVPFEKPLEASACADLLADSVRRDPVRFEGSVAAPTAGSGAALDKLAAIMKRCGTASIRVAQRMPAEAAAESPPDLARRRADSIVAALGARGVENRLSADAGSGATSAPAPTDDAGGRTEFDVSAAKEAGQ